MTVLVSLMLLMAAADVSTAAPPAVHLQAAPCSDSTSTTAFRVRNLLKVAGSIENPPGRLRELAGVDPSQLRLLRRGSDSQTCQQIRQLALSRRQPDRVTGRPWQVTVYEGGGYYFAVVSRDWDPTAHTNQGSRVRLQMGNSGGWIAVFDREFEPVIATNG